MFKSCRNQSSDLQLYMMGTFFINGLTPSYIMFNHFSTLFINVLISNLNKFYLNLAFICKFCIKVSPLRPFIYNLLFLKVKGQINDIVSSENMSSWDFLFECSPLHIFYVNLFINLSLTLIALLGSSSTK